MSPGGKTRTSKGPKSDKSSGVTQNQINKTKTDQNHNEKDKDSIPHKIAPTAEQLRIAQMIDNTHPEKMVQEKISQVVQVTGVSTDDAAVALHDCDNDVNAAIDALLEGEDQGKWQESTKKKKKATGTKGKDDSESNKENRRVENRERSGSRARGGGAGGPPRFRGRGGGRGGREETSEGIGRGSGARKVRMTNGMMGPSSRGRGMRGRGGSSGLGSSRTFQKRQNQQPFIDTWASVPEKIENNADSLQIDNWDDEISTNTAGTEDWDSEWTGSLDNTTVFKTTVFSPSAGISAGLAGSIVPPEPMRSLSPPPCQSLSNSLNDSINSMLGTPSSNTSSITNSANLPPSLSESVTGVISMGQPPLNEPMSSHSYQNSTNSISQSQTLDLTALLQKAAPHSTLGRLPPNPMVDGSGLVSSSLEGKNSILGGMGSSVAEGMNNVILSNSAANPIISSNEPPPSQSYSPASSSMSISNSMFSNSVSNLAGSLSSVNSVNKVLNSMTTQNASLASRTKPQRSRLTHSSKIPSKAVEMPEVAMAALDIQFTGLEFGTETFDFSSPPEMKPPPLMGNIGVSASSVPNRVDPSSVSVAVSKDLGALSSANLPQSLCPQPIPFPSQTTERKPPTQSTLLSGTQRPSASAVKSLADLTKKDTTTAPPPSLGSLVGSSPASHTPYQSSSSAGYGPKASSFPSPPAHYSNTHSQNYSSSNSSVNNSSNYSGSSVNMNSSGSAGSNSSSSNQTGGGYGSSYSGQASVASGQYPNNYVNVSSHSLAAMSSVAKDSAQSYNDVSGTSSSLSGSLSTSAGGSSTGPGLSSVTLNSATTSSVQPSKSSVPGKTVNSLGGSVQPVVQQHSVSQAAQHQVGQQQLGQHPQSHHHLQQQQQQQQVAQQTQQLVAGPSQYVSPQQAALGAIPPPFYNVQQPAMYSFEDLQVFQQRMPHMQPGAPSTLTGGRDGTITSPPSYSVAEANKFRTDQNSSPVPSTINQQHSSFLGLKGAAAGATYITAPGNAGMPPFYMYPTIPSTFSQYGGPAIIQIPSNTHTGSTTTQFPGPPKIPYGATSNYYENLSQTQDYKSGYGSASQGQSKSGPSSAGSAANSASDLSGYKNHLGKVGRGYDKQTFHTGTPPPFNLGASGTNPMAANYTPMYIPTMPPAAQHHSSLMHHQLHQDGSSTGAQRAAAGGGQSKGGAKSAYTAASYWTN